MTIRENRLVKGFRRAIYFARTGYLHTGERVNPDFPNLNFENHFKVYKFLRQFASGKRILDVGCGTGYGAAFLAEVSREVVGIDISKPALRLARKKYPLVKFLCMDAHDLKFSPNSFDIIVSTENFEHLADQPGHLRQLVKVLDEDGLCFIATPNPEMFVGTRNPYHTKENTFVEVTDLLSTYFDDVVVLENQLNPSTPEGQRSHADRFVRGGRGLTGADKMTIFGRELNTAYLSNTHSFFCFCKHPKKV